MQKYVNVVIPPINQPFTYSLDQTAAMEIGVGSQVNVPFGRRFARGFVISEAEFKNIAPGIKIKTINPDSSVRQCFDKRDLAFFSWVAEYYGESLSNIIDAAIPSPARKKKVIYAEALSSEPRQIRSKPQAAIYQALQSAGRALSTEELRSVHKSASRLVKELEKAGFVRLSEREVLDRHISGEEAPAWTKSEITLNQKQRDAYNLIVKNIDSRDSQPILLHGATGSGKTEVYIEAIQHCIKKSLGVLILVPEIALTPQLIDRFRARLGNQIAVLHSALNKNIRWDSWRALLEKRNFVAIGARSAVFAPVPNLGLIVIDEEHDPSYKQSDGLRYNARDIAVMRAKITGCPIVLGSATPSLETFHRAWEKKYFYKQLQRHSNDSAGMNLKVELVDLSKIKLKDMPSKNISPRLYEKLKSTLEEGGQAFILYNRRGFATYLQCKQCEESVNCKNCSVTLTYHKKIDSLLCHYCSSRRLPPERCENCKQGELSERGAGTEKVFEELKQLFPDTAIDRLDRDTVDNLLTYRHILDNVRSGHTKILVGTQMIAKGHDLPGVTLVGIVDCDVGLHLPDFRSAEKTFQLLTQAAGRAGRGAKTGTVILQTREPKHHSLQTTLSQNYLAFAEAELKFRKAAAYPPFSRLVRLVASGEEKGRPLVYLDSLKKRFIEVLKDDAKKLLFLGPAEAALSKIKNSYRYNLLIKGNSVTLLNRVVRIAAAAKARAKKVRLTIDVDPQDML